jgi:hypothetical protein
LDESDKDKAVSGLRGFVHGNSALITRALEVYPAITAWLIASTLADMYRSGTNVTSEIYPHIERAFATDSISNSSRQEMSKAFRRACQKFGLIVSAGHSNMLVDDYVCQAGIAKSQLPELIRAFMKAERAYGPAPDEDTHRLNMWEDKATQVFAKTMSRLNNVMIWDESAYYAGCYARVRRGMIAPDGLESAIAEQIELALQSGHGGTGEHVELPHFALVDGFPAIVAPSRTHICATLKGRQKRINAGRPLSLPFPLPESVAWYAFGTETQTADVMPFLSTPTAVAIFDADTGVLLRALRETEAKTSFAIDATDLAIVSRSAFTAGTDTGENVGFEAYIAFHRLDEAFDIRVGSASYRVTPPSRPRLEIDGHRIGTGPFGGLFTQATSITVYFPAGRPDGEIILSVEHPALSQPADFPILRDRETVDLGAILPVSGVAGKLRVALTLGRNGRVLVQKSQWMWPGLVGLSCLAFQGPRPENYAERASNHILCDRGRLYLNGETSYRFATLSFSNEPPSGMTDIVSFEVARPGRSVTIVDEGGHEKSHPIGSRITILPGTTEWLVIRTDDPLAALRVRGRPEANSFGKSGVRRVPLTLMDDKLANNQIDYLPGGDPNKAEKIAELGLSVEPTAMHFRRDASYNGFEVECAIPCLVDAVQLTVSDMLTGKIDICTLAMGRRPVEGRRGCIVHGSPGWLQDDGNFSRLYLQLDTSDFGEGLWIAEMAIRRDGDDAFRDLRNTRGDCYPFILTHQLDKGEGMAASVSAGKAFERLSNVLNRCVARQCWDAFQPAVTAWRTLGAFLAAKGRRDALMKAWSLAVPFGQSSTWVPIHHSIEVCPELLGVNCEWFQHLDREVDGFDELNALSQVSGLSRATDAVHDMQLTPDLFRGFSNVQQVMTGKSQQLGQFSFQTFARTLATHEPSGSRAFSRWRPSDRRLTQVHQDFCLGRFIERFESACPDGYDTNEDRMIRLNRMANRSRPKHRDLALPAGNAFADGNALAGILPGFMSLIAREARYGRSVELWDELSAMTEQTLVETLEDIGFLTRLAPELLAFYLLLWELVKMGENT